MIVAEASSGNTLDGFENFKYRQLIAEYRSLKVELIDLNREGKYITAPLIDTNLQMFPVRLAARSDGPRCVYCERVDTEDARLRGGDNEREERGDGRSAAQPECHAGRRERPGQVERQNEAPHRDAGSRPWALT